jgi:hypothetical protein
VEVKLIVDVLRKVRVDGMQLSAMRGTAERRAEIHEETAQQNDSRPRPCDEADLLQRLASGTRLQKRLLVSGRVDHSKR